uniref:Rho GDP-dissociation inhibitor 1 n=1 Tax=Pseudonaja textilis TaxID=8673 RepID=A0A670XYK2_PSETE
MTSSVSVMANFLRLPCQKLCVCWCTQMPPPRRQCVCGGHTPPEAKHPVNYKPPAQKSIQEIQELDKDDESLHNHMVTKPRPPTKPRPQNRLLKNLNPTPAADPFSPNVVVTKLTLVCASAPGPLELNLRGDLESFKKQAFVLKEGVEYQIKISFQVKREIVSGLKYIHYGPWAEEYEFLTPLEEAPKGMLAWDDASLRMVHAIPLHAMCLCACTQDPPL